MYAILKKDIQTFFSNTIGYLVIAVFLIVNGLFLWVFQGDFNVFNYGFAELSSYFRLAPWVLLFLIPAVTMRSIAEERKQGTLELLLTKPISSKQLILGKYFGALSLIVIAILPTLVYVWTIYALGNPTGNLDLGVILTSYIGMLLLASTFVAIGLFASSVTQNQLVAFIIAVLICFLMFYGFDGISSQLINESSFNLSFFGLQYHYDSLGRGVLDTRDLIYFISITVLFIALTHFNIKRYTN
jgi:ABC-2 type transport system permease protein